MKLAHYFLALYTVLLSCIPCQDDLYTYEALKNSGNEQIASADKETSDHNSVDLCSPFCICACCSAITLHHAVAALPASPFFSFPDEKTFAYAHRIGSGDLTSIWQPPRI